MLLLICCRPLFDWVALKRKNTAINPILQSTWNADPKEEYTNDTMKYQYHTSLNYYVK